MNRFRDLSTNQVSRRSNNFKRDASNNRFKPSSRFSPRNNVPLPTNNRWTRDEPPSKPRNNFVREPTKMSNVESRPDPNLAPHELNSRFVDIKSMAIGFEQISSKPKQNKNKKKKKKNNNNTLSHEQEKPTVKKYSKKYNLSNDEDDLLNASIVNQYNYEVIEESEEDNSHSQEEQ